MRSPTTASSIAGHQPSIPDLLEDIYVLLALFLSSRPIAELDESRLYESDDPVRQFGQFGKDLITKKLIAVAITIRILDDRQAEVFSMLTDYCGTITKDVDKPIETTGLGLRDACNKVIHARSIEFDFGSTKQGVSYLNPYIYLAGNQNSKKWSANLYIEKFCRESAAAANLLK